MGGLRPLAPVELVLLRHLCVSVVKLFFVFFVFFVVNKAFRWHSSLC